MWNSPHKVGHNFHWGYENSSYIHGVILHVSAVFRLQWWWWSFRSLNKNGQHNPEPFINNGHCKQLLRVALISAQNKDKVYGAAGCGVAYIVYSLRWTASNACFSSPLYLAVVLFTAIGLLIQEAEWALFSYSTPKWWGKASHRRALRTPMQVHNWTTNNLHASTRPDKHWPST